MRIPLQRFARLIAAIDGFNRAVGEVAAWLVLLTVLVCAAVALLRYGLSVGRVWLQELYVVAFGLSFMLAAPRAYAEDAHVRIDILSRQWGPRARAAVELLGCAVFLLPWLAVLAWSSRPFVRLAWLVHEPSPQAGGLPGLYLVKSVIPLFAALMLLQAAGCGGSQRLRASRPRRPAATHAQARHPRRMSERWRRVPGTRPVRRRLRRHAARLPGRFHARRDLAPVRRLRPPARPL